MMMTPANSPVCDTPVAVKCYVSDGNSGWRRRNDTHEKLECDCLHSKTKPRRGGADGRRHRREECKISSCEDGRAAPNGAVQPVSQTPVSDGVEAECEVDSAVGCEPDGAALQVFLETLFCRMCYILLPAPESDTSSHHHIKMASGLYLIVVLCVTTGLWFPANANRFDDEGWTKFGDHLYRFYNTPMEWSDAERFCTNLDANLAPLLTPDIYNFIRQIIVRATGTNTDTWVGGTDASKRPEQSREETHKYEEAEQISGLEDDSATV
ncbi:hypothetical protein Q5P01_024067 [Channa striata]|uniref:C-type lectin domain-containing protein n=1 Tax=Channa striata TaxID=64152 RepID=A0AA88IQY8_CHASR|nr:hypothetical protein Q5P01_024067 [Channa striata]